MAFEKILIVGCGNMAGAMLEGWLAAGLDPARFTIASPHEKPFEVEQHRAIPLKGEWDAILLGVKPQKLGEIEGEVSRLAGPRTRVLSLLAGTDLSRLEAAFPEAAAVVRVMPNLAVAIGKSPIALAERGLDDGERQELLDLMAPLGPTAWVDEAGFDLNTTLTGSGPAFVYRFVDALAAAATELGMDEAQARRLALSMVDGAVALAVRSGADPGELARRVASPGGTTEQGLAVLDRDGALVRLLTATLRASCEKSAQMAAQAKK